MKKEDLRSNAKVLIAQWHVLSKKYDNMAAHLLENREKLWSEDLFSLMQKEFHIIQGELNTLEDNISKNSMIVWYDNFGPRLKTDKIDTRVLCENKVKNTLKNNRKVDLLLNSYEIEQLAATIVKNISKHLNVNTVDDLDSQETKM